MSPLSAYWTVLPSRLFLALTSCLRLACGRIILTSRLSFQLLPPLCAVCNLWFTPHPRGSRPPLSPALSPAFCVASLAVCLGVSCSYHGSASLRPLCCSPAVARFQHFPMPRIFSLLFVAYSRGSPSQGLFRWARFSGASPSPGPRPSSHPRRLTHTFLLSSSSQSSSSARPLSLLVLISSLHSRTHTVTMLCFQTRWVLPRIPARLHLPAYSDASCPQRPPLHRPHTVPCLLVPILP